MDDGVRSWRLLLKRAAFLAISVACASRPGTGVGFSHDGETHGVSAVDASVPVRTLDVLPKDYRTHLKKVMTASPSQHALGRFDGDVWTDETASLFVEEHRERSTGKTGPIYVMKRSPEGWTWFAQDDTGVLLDDKTNASVRGSCAGCHADAPSDGVFR